MFHTAKPQRLIGREKETEEVRSFMKGHMSKKTAGSLYISGAPGTGKTAVLTHIIDEMKVSVKTVRYKWKYLRFGQFRSYVDFSAKL